MARLRATTATRKGLHTVETLAPGAPEQFWDDFVPDTEVVVLDPQHADRPGHAIEARQLAAYQSYCAAYEAWADELYAATGHAAPLRPRWRPTRRRPWPTTPLPTRTRRP